jgi:protein ImuA
MREALDHLAELRRVVASPQARATQGRCLLGHDEADACLGGGLLRGTLHEVFASDTNQGAAATGFAVGLSIRAAEKKKLLWVRQDFSALEYGELSATGLLGLGIDPGQLILLRAADAAGVLRAAAEGLTCTALGAVVAEIEGKPKILDLVASRRLTLLAAQKNVTAILLRLGAEPEPSAAETRWIVRAARSENEADWGAALFDAELNRHRHGQTGHWVMEWSSEDGFFKKPRHKAHSGGLAAFSANRPAAAADEVCQRAG